MFSKVFYITSWDYHRSLTTIIQKKLRIVMRCYVIRDFVIDYDEKTYFFKKSHRMHGITIKDEKEYKGVYEVEDTQDEMIKLTLTI